MGCWRRKREDGQLVLMTMYFCFGGWHVGGAGTTISIKSLMHGRLLCSFHAYYMLLGGWCRNTTPLHVEGGGRGADASRAHRAAQCCPPTVPNSPSGRRDACRQVKHWPTQLPKNQ